MDHNPRVKICGVTREADVREAARLGADALGFNCYPESPRFVPPAELPGLLRPVPPFVEAVGVFVGLPLRAIWERIEPLHRLRTVQWYGPDCEPPGDYPFELIPSFPVRDAESLEAIRRYLERCHRTGRLPAAILVDAHVAGQHGGTGRRAPWELLAGFRPGVPLLLAGGLTPANVAEAVRTVRPYAVDVASGVERCPGQKDPEKIRQFIANARGFHKE